MRRAFVGFSTPIGYMYQVPASETPNDQQSSPNPVLFGSMGLMTLYDEIWFACASLCPQSMRDLPYVKFLDVDAGKVDLSAVGFSSDVERMVEQIPYRSSAGINDLFPDGYDDGMTKYLGGRYSTDNHTHGLDFSNVEFSGNLGFRQLAADVWLLGRYKNLGLDLVLNPLTARFGLDTPDGNGAARVRALGLADRVLTVGSLYDITGKEGPYHPCVEEIRGDPLLIDFRLWMDDQQSKIDNYDMAMVEREVNERVGDLTRTSLRTHVQRKHLAGTTVKLVKGELMGKIPLASALDAMSQAAAHNFRVNAQRHGAFIALTRMTLADARAA